ncbi:murein hydrolase activator EnvC family protein [Brachybacterium fresconis]|uniref:Murein DD-endopeptidase MepM/ murein hydrolase activator NlpD n=1 Tax=Brachybacterium fresconis TaxID=173363 RepID=A0ABS4YQU3_9MICO|nr:peptidoglycan DD-metalloendopeptidase family protein [Brachybacterium fresconis]MBP2410757.1 murein DD-endopeptidase MepM/ murein hydrolase activator NlpD [Brachybacterium fresconis]
MVPRHLSASSSQPPRPMVLRVLRIMLVVLCLLLALAVPGPAGAEGTAQTDGPAQAEGPAPAEGPAGAEDPAGTDGPARGEGPRWQWPVPGPHPVVHPFDAPENPYGPGHRGIDVAVDGAGTPVRAVEAGTVRFSGDVAGRGVVSVLHADGLISTYEPVTGALEKGAKVRAGEVLGEIADDGASHCSSRSCLHLGARRGQGYLDPEVLLGAWGPSVLLPWSSDGRAAAGSAVAGHRAPEDRAAIAGAAAAEAGAAVAEGVAAAARSEGAAGQDRAGAQIAPAA